MNQYKFDNLTTIEILLLYNFSYYQPSENFTYLILVGRKPILNRKS